MICAIKPQNIVAQIYLDNHKLHQVSEFPYLGSIFVADSWDIREIKRRIGLAKTAFSKTSKLFTSKTQWQLVDRGDGAIAPF